MSDFEVLSLVVSIISLLFTCGAFVVLICRKNEK